MIFSQRKYKIPYLLVVCCLLFSQLTGRIICASANDSGRMSVSFSRRRNTADSAVYPYPNDSDFATLSQSSAFIRRDDASSLVLDSSAAIPVPSRGITTTSSRERSSACNTLTTSTLRQPNPFLSDSSLSTSSLPIYDYGKELLLYDALTRENSTSLLSAPFYAAGHCPAPFSQVCISDVSNIFTSLKLTIKMVFLLLFHFFLASSFAFLAIFPYYFSAGYYETSP